MPVLTTPVLSRYLNLYRVTVGKLLFNLNTDCLPDVAAH